MKRTVLVISLLLLVLAFSAFAQSISTQGVLRYASGQSVDDGDYDMIFSIYDAESGGSLLWNSGTETVPVLNGVYQVVLGDEANPISSFNSSGGNYLEIELAGEIMEPRLRLNVTPYEMAYLDGASNVFPESGNTGIGTTGPQTKLTIVATGDNVDLLQLDGNNDSEKQFTFQGMFAGTGGSGNALKLRSHWVDKIMFWRDDGHVGIGTQDPTHELTVEGAIQATGYIGNRGPEMGQQMENGDADLTTLRFDSDKYRIFAGGTGGADQVVTIQETGEVGIGTAAPDVKLHIDGASDAGPAGGGLIQLGASDGANLRIDHNEIMATNNGDPANLYLNYYGGDVRMGGEVRSKVASTGEFWRPFQFQEFTASANDKDANIETGWSDTDWIAAVVGFSAGSGDVWESGSHYLWRVTAYTSGGQWKIRCTSPTHIDLADWRVRVMFVNTKFGSASAAYKTY